MKARVTVRLRPGVLDPEGATIRKALEGIGFREVRDLRIERVFELTLEEHDRARALARLDEMCRRLLANPVTEEYACEVDETPGGPAAGAADGGTAGTP